MTSFLKDWLKQQGRTQADLRRSLRAISTRMPAILDVLQRDHQRMDWPVWPRDSAPWNPNGTTGKSHRRSLTHQGDPFSQLDVLLQEIRQDCPD